MFNRKLKEQIKRLQEMNEELRASLDAATNDASKAHDEYALEHARNNSLVVENTKLKDKVEELRAAYEAMVKLNAAVEETAEKPAKKKKTTTTKKKTAKASK